MPPASVNVTKAEIKALAPVSWVSGTVVSQNDARIAAEVSGRLVTLAPIGTAVKQGEVLAKIDDKSLLIQRNEAKAKLANAKAKLTFKQAELQRSQALIAQNLSSKTDVDDLLSQRDIARGEIDIAKAQLDQIEQQIDYASLEAPFDGLVVERLSSIGELVDNGTAIIRLVQTSDMEASVYAPIASYRFIKQRTQLAVQSDLGQGVAKIKSLVPVANSRSHLMEVRLDMSPFNWPVGLNIKVAIASGEDSDVLAVPRDALVLRRNSMSVFRINSDNKAEEVPVTVGIGAGALVEVKGALQAGDVIVIRGAERLRAGQPVQIKASNQSLVNGP